MNATEHQRVTRGIVAVCQHCPREKVRSIQGSMRITSNFVRHLKTLHPAKYEEFIIERQNHSRTPKGRRGQKRKASQFGDGQVMYIYLPVIPNVIKRICKCRMGITQERKAIWMTIQMSIARMVLPSILMTRNQRQQIIQII